MLSVNELKKAYGGKQAVDGVSFRVEKGQCFGLLGPNGAGKSTCIEIMEGINKADSGTVELFGKKATKDVYKKLGIQFQHTALPDHMNCIETLTMFARFYSKPIDRQQLIEMCSLEQFLTTDVRKLSGGQRQRLLLALALINDPQILFLDEPTAGLDPQARRHFWRIIESIKKQGKTIILTTHYMDEAQVLCDDIAIMDNGKILQQGSPEALLEQHFSKVVVSLPLEQLEGVQGLEFSINGDRGDFSVNNIEDLLTQLMAQKVSLQGLWIHKPNLEDLFIKLTGHHLRN